MVARRFTINNAADSRLNFRHNSIAPDYTTTKEQQLGLAMGALGTLFVEFLDRVRSHMQKVCPRTWSNQGW